MSAAASNRHRKPHLALVTANSLRTGGMQTFTRHLLETVRSADWRVTIALSGEDIYSDLVCRQPSIRGFVCHCSGAVVHDVGPPNGIPHCSRSSGTHSDRHSTRQDNIDGTLASCGLRGFDVEHVDWVNHTLAGDRAYGLRVIMDRRRWFRRVRPNVALFVQSSNAPFRASIAGAWLARVPIVITHRTMPWVKDFTPSGRHLLGLVPGIGIHNRRQVFKTWLTAALADRIVYNSINVRRCYEYDYRYPRRKGHVIVNAVQAPAAAGSDRGHSDAITIGYVGRLADEKRIDVLIRAIAALETPRHVRLLIHGEGPQRPPLAALADELGIADRVEWCGPADDVWSAYEKMDVVALCSRRESSSNMALEAMAAGKAVVVTDAGGLPELIGHGGWGLCVPAGDVPALAAALDKLIDNDDARMRLGTQAREVARARHDPRAVGRAWLDLLTEVAGRRAVRYVFSMLQPIPSRDREGAVP